MGWTRKNGEYSRETNDKFGLDVYSKVWWNLHADAGQESTEKLDKDSKTKIHNKHGQHSKRSTICQALLKVRLPPKGENKKEEFKMHYAKLDSCSSADICAEHLLHNIKDAQEYERPVIRMKQAHGKTPW
mgnify:CR=1 FL=1